MDSFGERLRQERKRLGYNQSDFAVLGGVQRRAQASYEADERVPDARYLAALVPAGLDVAFVISGERDGPEPVSLSPDEAVLLDGYRSLDSATKKRMLAFVLGSESQPVTKTKNMVTGGVQQNFNAPVGTAVAGDVVNKGRGK